MECKKRVYFFDLFRENDPVKAELIEKELGKERLEFLVYKLQTQDKIKEMEEKIEKINEELRENDERPENPFSICNAGYLASATDTTIHKKKSFLSKCLGFVRTIDVDHFVWNLFLPIAIASGIFIIVMWIVLASLGIIPPPHACT